MPDAWPAGLNIAFTGPAYPMPFFTSSKSKSHSVTSLVQDVTLDRGVPWELAKQLLNEHLALIKQQVRRQDTLKMFAIIG